ncbi:hypothetical protein SAMN05444156_0235 [Verrucomicrobium sp. GAS474]|uniref:hypothetical protein n=1 Tax=Verrucomicrobium sp. GAS474 TaxID=1882831 RepID=UPI00087CAC90|nr:hypothetical protein [Verrucomicrobium sp. GAS474]SDT86828.1 hypothetical protein SAMN05444156_0235 [Verrucomicrobium sp. GAS474]
MAALLPLPPGFKREVFRAARALMRRHFWRVGWLLFLALLPESFYVLYRVGAAFGAFDFGNLLDPDRTMENIAALTAIAATASAWGGWSELVPMAVSLPLWIGCFAGLLHLARGERPAWGDMALLFRKPLDWLLALPAAVPGLLLAPLWIFYPMVMIDEGIGPVAALRRSGELTRGARWQVLFSLCLLAAFLALGSLLGDIGLILTLPISCVTAVVFYDRLKGREALCRSDLAAPVE